MSATCSWQELGAPHARRIQDHQHRAVIEAIRRLDQAGHLLHTQDRRQTLGRLRVRRVVEEIATPQRLHEEEPQRRHVEPDGLWLELPRPQEVRLVAAQVRVIETVGSTLEVPSEPLHGVEIAANGRRREVPALELLQHDAATMGHKTPPVTRTLPRRSERASRAASAAPAAWSKRRRDHLSCERRGSRPDRDLLRVIGVTAPGRARSAFACLIIGRMDSIDTAHLDRYATAGGYTCL